MGASTTIRTVEIAQGEVSYESDMEMDALANLMEAGNTGDLREISGALSGFILSWPFKGDPTKPADWGKLKRSEFNAVTKGVMEDLGDLGNE